VLKALQETDIPVDIIAGISMGAVVGAASAAGYGVEELEYIATHMRWNQLLRLADPNLPRQGLIAGNRLEEYFNTLVLEKDFTQLEKTFIAVATDILSGDEVRINSGSVARALRASTALPGIFNPVRSGQSLLIDGTITTQVPLEAAVDAGAALVVAVDVSSPVDRADILLRGWNWGKKLPGYNWLGSSGLSRFVKPLVPESINTVGRSLELYYSHPKNSADVTPPVLCLRVKPAVDNVRWFEFHRVEECIQAGETVGRQVACHIKTLMEQGTTLEKLVISS
jgi:NTE family protein